jgi:hypothetical protein
MPNAPRSKLWLWIVAALALQLAAWAVWFTIASKNRVAEVPLATRPAQR